MGEITTEEGPGDFVLIFKLSSLFFKSMCTHVKVEIANNPSLASANNGCIKPNICQIMQALYFSRYIPYVIHVSALLAMSYFVSLFALSRLRWVIIESQYLSIALAV